MTRPDDRTTIPHPGREAEASRLLVLDGWRAFSILAVLAAHMLPLGPKPMLLNASAGLVGMAVFFTLSGFLITSALLRDQDVASFAIRRLCRILPLAYVAAAIYLAIDGAGWRAYASHALFATNYDHDQIAPHTRHFWSLCVEVQFYAFVAALVGLAGARGLLALPALMVVVTAIRVHAGARESIATHLRVDEILAGATLALIYHGRLGAFGRGAARVVARVPLPVVALAFLGSTLYALGPWMYLRPYLAAWLVGQTLLTDPSRHAWLRNRPMRYVAEVSFALYIVHVLSMVGWLGEGGTVARYAKRPLCFAITFALAHASTFHFERHWTAWGKQAARRLRSRDSARPSTLAAPSLGSGAA